MTRIAGVNIPDNKRVLTGLTYVYGIGPTVAANMLKKMGYKKNPKFSELSEVEIDQLRSVIEKEVLVEGDLRQVVGQNIRRLKEIGSYRGLRHIKKLPAHGQRTKTNARTKRGKKVTMGSGRKKSSEKT